MQAAWRRPQPPVTPAPGDPLPLASGISTQSFTCTHPAHITKHKPSQKTSRSSPTTLGWQMPKVGAVSLVGRVAAGETEGKSRVAPGFNTLIFSHSVLSLPRSARI